jgi:hypothetical protein
MTVWLPRDNCLPWQILSDVIPIAVAAQENQFAGHDCIERRSCSQERVLDFDGLEA